jgi:hypothetical protein
MEHRIDNEPTEEELQAWLEEQKVKDKARYAALHAEAVGRLEKWAAGEKPPKWFDDIERKLGARIARIDLANGASFRRVSAQVERRVYNWRLAARLIAEGADYWKVAHELGCTVEAVQRRMREGSKLRKWVAAAHRERAERMEFAAARQGERIVGGLDSELDDLREDRDPAIKRWLLKRMLGDRPADSRVAATPKKPRVPARISLNKPKQAGISLD